MLRTLVEILENRRRLRAEYEALFDSMPALLFRHNPIGVNFDSNTDEYEPEVDTMLARMRGCHSSDDVLEVVTKSSFAGLIQAPLGHQSAIEKSLLKFGDCGKVIKAARRRCRRSVELSRGLPSRCRGISSSSSASAMVQPTHRAGCSGNATWFNLSPSDVIRLSFRR